MSKVWMVRAGEGGYLIDEFARGYVAIGWQAMGDMSSIQSQDEMREKYIKAYPDNKIGMVGNAAAMAYKFCRLIQKGDKVISYDPQTREYLVGDITSDYQFNPGVIGDFPHIRSVSGVGRVPRDSLSVTARNSLGSTLTLFAVNEDVWVEIETVLSGKKEVEAEPGDDESEVLDNIKEQSKEFIKDRISRLSPYELQELVAGLLRAMGYKTRVSPPGSDRGIDILASPDGFGFEQPRIVVECKHRKGAMGSQEIRSFLGGRHKDDKGLYVSTGGFTKDARYEADRASIPLTLMDMDQLVDAIADNYEKMDSEVRTLLPLVKVYLPA